MPLPGFTITSIDDVPAMAVTSLITVKTIKEPTPDDPSVIQWYRMAPNATAGEDLHHESEHLYILEGEFHDGDRAWPAGSRISGKRGSVHYPSSKLGCTFLAFFPNGLGKAD